MREPAGGRFPHASFRLVPPVLAIVLVLGLAGAMAIEPTRQLLEQRSRIAQMTAELRELNRSNRRLEKRVDRLKDPDYLEQQAREQIGLIRPGETAYVVMTPDRSAGMHRPKAKRRRAARRPSPPSFSERLLHFLGF